MQEILLIRQDDNFSVCE